MKKNTYNQLCLCISRQQKKKLKLKKAKTIFLKFSCKTKNDQNSITYQNFPPKQSKFTFTTSPQKRLENMPCKIREKGKDKISDWNTTNYVTLLSHSASIYHQTSTIFPVLRKEVIGFEPSQLIIKFHQYYGKY